MRGFRTWLRRHSRIAALIVAAALVLRIAVPGGYMPQLAGHAIAISICTGTGAVPATLDLPAKHPGAGPGGCAFADLAVPGLAPVDPLLLAGALAFVLALWLARSRPLALRRAGHLRPPLRGPPAPL